MSSRSKGKEKANGASSVLLAAEDHFANRGVQSMEMPEWCLEDGQPVTIYWEPLNLKQADRIYKLAKGDNLQTWVEAIIMKAMDAEGNKLFSIADRRRLMQNVDPAPLQRLGTAIASGEGVESHLGN